MIITEKKPFSKIIESLEGYDRIFILGCADCATLCSTGGEIEVEDMKLKLEKRGKSVTGVLVPDTPCHVQKVRRELRISKEEVTAADAMIVLACGAGVQSVSEVLPAKTILPGLNTLFLGNTIRYGWFDERCSLCGNCILDRTMGICPITRCAKSLVNGPCGGSKDGKCEVDGNRDCAWHLIFERAKKAGRMDILEKYQPMMDFEISIKPGSLDIRKETQDERASRVDHFKQQKLQIRKKFHKLAKDRIKKDEEINLDESVSRLQEELESGKFVVTCEIIPPKGIDVENTLNHARSLKQYITAFSINENPGSIMRLGSLSMSALFAREGMEPILHLTTRERNRLALQSELLGAYVMGIRNTLAMTGDHQSVGDHKEAKPVYDLDSVQLIKLATELTRGRDYNGNPLEGSPRFHIGGVVNPGSDMLAMQIIKMKKKVEAGASFFITQGIYDIELLKRFLDEVEKAGIKTRIIAGIIFLKSEKMARYMLKNIPGIIIPDSLIERMENTKDKKSVSLEIAREILEECRGLVDGVHLMPIGRYDMVPDVLED
ncbi:MAG: methylenetetrahydrofolate reductase C-terminal domain-containing protein [Candidatus Eremiobacteraeota bacterium]|nr:methylenetetrahydrofolate reductase C-terminal domain-containing protein [Candidatus Eremiobacteraeota bacterium]